MKMGKLTESTLVPIGVVAVAVGLAWGFAVDYTTVKADVKQTKEQGNDTSDAQKKYLEVVRRIDKRLSRLEWKAGIRTPGE